MSTTQSSQTPRKPGCFLSFLIIVAGFAAFAFYGAEYWQRLAKNFFQGTITTSTQEVLLEVSRTNGDVLEVASPLKMMELFEKSDARYGAWGWVYLGTTASEIKVPVDYHFHIKLSELSRARIENKVLIVEAPPVRPTLPVAFHSQSLERKTSEGWLRFDGQEQLTQLEKNITPALALRAQDQVKNIRDAARHDIQAFVQKWIVNSNPAYRHEVVAVKVVFLDEDASKVQAQAPLP